MSTSSSQQVLGDPGQGWQTTLGLLAIPSVFLVMTSEAELYFTGCGLEPGPGGLLGLAEGVAYLITATTALVQGAAMLGGKR